MELCWFGFLVVVTLDKVVSPFCLMSRDWTVCSLVRLLLLLLFVLCSVRVVRFIWDIVIVVPRVVVF